MGPFALEWLPWNVLSLCLVSRNHQGPKCGSTGVPHAWTWTYMGLSPSPGFSPSGFVQPSTPHRAPIRCSKEQKDSCLSGYPEASRPGPIARGAARQADHLHWPVQYFFWGMVRQWVAKMVWMYWPGVIQIIYVDSGPREPRGIPFHYGQRSPTKTYGSCGGKLLNVGYFAFTPWRWQCEGMELKTGKIFKLRKYWATKLDWTSSFSTLSEQWWKALHATIQGSRPHM